MGLIAWEKIGNKSSVIKQQKVEIKDGIVELPCNVDALEAVTTD
jgi:hypothetical protein